MTVLTRISATGAAKLASMTPRKTWLVLEALALFVAVPLLFAARLVPIPIIPAMMAIAVPCLIYLAVRRDYSLKHAFNLDRLRFQARPILGTFIWLAPLMVAILYSLEPDYLFILPRERTLLWVVIMCFYPFVSVLPQTVIWRGFLMHRYSPLIGRGWVAVTIATVAFSFAHIYFLNTVALLVTAVGGLMFLLSYLRTRSLLISAIEHALYGCWAFTVGYGRFLYGGTVPAGP